MSWWGKLIGGAFGFMLGGPIGALLGSVAGHTFDKGMEFHVDEEFDIGDQERLQTAFFTTTFSVVGYISKVDGQVSQNEIIHAQALMDRMSLNSQQRKLAIELFQKGKSPDFQMESVVSQFRMECHGRKTVTQMFLEIQIQAALADGILHQTEMDALEKIAKILKFSSFEFKYLLARVQAELHFAQAGQRQQSSGYHYQEQQYQEQHYQQQANDTYSLANAYEVLGLQQGASMAEVKKTYRRLMSQHHPDKLVAKGMPEEMIKLATEKTQEIQKAYEKIKKNQ